jgi:hypothetical protein
MKISLLSKVKSIFTNQKKIEINANWSQFITQT